MDELGSIVNDIEILVNRRKDYFRNNRTKLLRYPISDKGLEHIRLENDRNAKISKEIQSLQNEMNEIRNRLYDKLNDLETRKVLYWDRLVKLEGHDLDTTNHFKYDLQVVDESLNISILPDDKLFNPEDFDY